MDSALVATVVGVLGAGFLGMLGYFLQALRSDIGTLGSRLGRVEKLLTRVEATLAEHGRLLERMADHGERIAALEGQRSDA